jgi:SPP1 gp7 family putative phage head morphogenesis protein
MLQLAQVAARARIFSIKQVEEHEDVLYEGDPSERLKSIIASPERKAAKAFLSAVDSARLSDEAITHSVEQGSPTRTLEDEYVKAFEVFAAELEGIELAMADSVVAQTAEGVERLANRKGVIFDSEPAKRTIESVYKTRNKALIVNLTRQQKQAVYSILSQGAREKWPTVEIAKRLRQTIGLTNAEAGSFGKLVERLRGKGWTGDRLAKATDRYKGTLIRARAIRIARTEMSWAHNSAQLETMKAASNRLAMPLEKEWFTSGDEVTCPICAGLKGTRVPLMGMFPVGANGVPNPPAHPHCRCAVIYVTPKLKPSAIAPARPQPRQQPIPPSRLKPTIPSLGAPPAARSVTQTINSISTYEDLEVFLKDYYNVRLAADAGVDTMLIDPIILKKTAQGFTHASALTRGGTGIRSLRVSMLNRKVYADFGVQEMRINYFWAKDAAGTKLQLFDDMIAGFHPKTDGDWADVIVHEAGHAIDKQRNLAFFHGGSWAKVPQSTQDKFTEILKTSKAVVKRELSIYAGKNQQEMFAEAFQAWSRKPDPQQWKGFMREFCEAMNEAQRYFT